MPKASAVQGIRRHSPPISRMSVCPLPWVMLPAPRKRMAFEKPCMSRWNMPAVRLPAPRASIMKPRSVSVE